MKGPIGSEKDEEFIFVGIPADAGLHFFFLSRLHLKHFSCCFCASETFLFCISILTREKRRKEKKPKVQMSYLQQAARDKKSLEINDARINIYLLHSVSPRQTSSRITKKTKGEKELTLKAKSNQMFLVQKKREKNFTCKFKKEISTSTFTGKTQGAWTRSKGFFIIFHWLSNISLVIYSQLRIVQNLKKRWCLDFKIFWDNFLFPPSCTMNKNV